MEDPSHTASEEAVIAATAHAEAVEKARTELMGNYYTRAETDTAHQEIVDNMTTQLITMKKSIDESMSLLATKDDILEMRKFMKNLKVGLGFFEFSWNNSAKIGSLALLALGIFLFFKVGFMGLISFFFTK